MPKLARVIRSLAEDYDDPDPLRSELLPDYRFQPTRAPAEGFYLCGKCGMPFRTVSDKYEHETRRHRSES